MENKANKKIFMVFNDVLKTANIAILKALLDPDMKKQFSDVIDYTRFEFMNEDNLLRLSIQRTDKNILRYLGTSDTFDYDKMYSMIYESLKSKFTLYPSLRMVEVIALAISTPQVSEVYVYSEEYDEEIKSELGLLFNANTKKIKYVYGDIYKCVANKDIALFIFPDLEPVYKLNDMQLIGNKEVLVANYGYNYTLSSEGQLQFNFDIENNLENKAFYKLRVFNPFELTERHMSQIYNNVDENNILSLG